MKKFLNFILKSWCTLFVLVCSITLVLPLAIFRIVVSVLYEVFEALNDATKDFMKDLAR